MYTFPMKRFWDKVDKTGDCWLWRGYIKPNGYATFRLGKDKVYVHRLSYEMANDKIPIGLVIDHTCSVRHCVNPSHLEAVTQRENLLRSPTIVSVESAKTHCSNGHEFNAMNTNYARGKRHCRVCGRDYQRKRRAAIGSYVY